MIAWKYKVWRTAGAALALTALVACGGEGGEAGEAGGEGGDGGGEAGEAAATAPATPGAPAATAGGEAGEAGAASAYAGLSGEQLTALRLQHLKGFVMAAAAVNADRQRETAEAAILVQQGILEVRDPAPNDFGSLDITIIQAVADSGSLNRAQQMQRIRAAEDEIDRAYGALDVDSAAIVARMVDIATGLYQGVVQADFVDPIEYQHSMGAARAAQAVLIAHQGELQRENLAAYSEARAALNRFVGLWPSAAAPEQPTPYREVLAQGSRVRLALSPFL